MSKTPFDQKNIDFSLRARKVAVEKIYPVVFGRGQAQDTTETEIDFNKGYDLIWLNDEGETYSIQERFRRPKYSEYREVTATACNAKSGQRGDFFKLQADWYVYAYFDEKERDFIELLIVEVDKLKNGTIQPGTQWYGRKRQKFFTWPFSEIIERGYHLYHKGRE